MRTEKGYERLSVFSDAVVAIAITLLVLPLVDLPVEAGQSVGDLLSEHRYELFAFLLSFVVIARLWLVHHRVGELTGNYDGPLVGATMVWLLTIVFLPFPTELLGQGGADERIVVGLYIGTLLVNVVCLAVLETSLLRRPELRRAGVTQEHVDEVTATWWLNPALLAAALALGAGVPGVGMWAMLLLFLDPVVGGALRKRHRKA